jgi:hypothetical protein
MQSIPTGDPGSLHPNDANYLKRSRAMKDLSMGGPTYWLSDKNKLPDLMDFLQGVAPSPKNIAVV